MVWILIEIPQKTTVALLPVCELRFHEKNLADVIFQRQSSVLANAQGIPLEWLWANYG